MIDVSTQVLINGKTAPGWKLVALYRALFDSRFLLYPHQKGS